MVRDISAGSSSPQGLTVVGQSLYFSARDAKTGRELWKSDGTAAGTELVRTSDPVGLSSDPAWLTDVDGRLYFTAYDVRRASSCGRATDQIRHGARARSMERQRELVSHVAHGLRRRGGVRRVESAEGRRAVAERRDRQGHAPGEGHQPGYRKLVSVGIPVVVGSKLHLVRQRRDERRRSRGRVTGPPRAPISSQISILGPKARTRGAHRDGRVAVLLGLRWDTRDSNSGRATARRPGRRSYGTCGAGRTARIPHPSPRSDASCSSPPMMASPGRSCG